MRYSNIPYANRAIRDMLPFGPGAAGIADHQAAEPPLLTKGDRMRFVSLGLGRSSRIAAVTALAALTLLVPSSVAQTPVADPAEEAHPAHIHSGTCDQLGDVVVPLTDVTTAAGEHVGAESAHGVKTSISVVDMPLQEIIDGGHAINVHESAEAIDVYIACGDIGGTLVTDEDGRTHLLIGLGELNDSGHTGTAWLGDDGEQTEVAITLIEPDEMQ
jgi:hypothetical protein